jgi:hypothetical protein
MESYRTNVSKGKRVKVKTAEQSVEEESSSIPTTLMKSEQQ